MKHNISSIDLMVKAIEIEDKRRNDNQYYASKGVALEWSVDLVQDKMNNYYVVLNAYNRDTRKKLWTSFDSKLYSSRIKQTQRYGLVTYLVEEDVMLSDKPFVSFKKDKTQDEAYSRAKHFAELISKAFKTNLREVDLRYNLDARSEFVVLQPESIDMIEGIKFCQSITAQTYETMSYDIDNTGADIDQAEFILDKNIKTKCGGNDFLPSNANAYVLRKRTEKGKPGSPFLTIEYEVDCYLIPNKKENDVRMQGRFYRPEWQRLKHDKPPVRAEKKGWLERFGENNWIDQYARTFRTN